MDSSAGSEVAELSRELKLPYAEQGDAAGIPVVLLHGFLDSLRSFELVLAHLPGLFTRSR
jgi:pimeloyl-ACP methyl ester carboxylesterase